MTDPARNLPLLRDAAAIALGLTVPAMVSGRAVLQGLAAVSLVLVLILAATDAGIRQRWREAVFSRFGLIVLAAFAAMAVSIPGALDPLRSADAWARTLGYIGACVLFWAFLAGDARAARWSRRALILSLIIGEGFVLVAQAGYTDPLRTIRSEFYQQNSIWAFLELKAYASAVACMLAPAAWTAWRERRHWRWLAAGSVVAGLVIVVDTDNKSALGGLLAAILLVTLVIAMRRSRAWLAAWVLWAAAASAAVLSLVYILPDEAPSTAIWDWLPPQLVDTHRQQIWHFTAMKIAEAPWTGWGINCIDRAPGARDIPQGYTVEVLPSHPHNWMLEILAETGLAGFVPVLIALAWFVARHARRYVTRGFAADFTLLGLAAVFWGSSLFNFSIWSSWWLITFFLLTAIMAAGPAAGEADNGRESRPPASAPGSG